MGKEIKIRQVALVEFFKDNKLSKDETMRNIKIIDKHYKSKKSYDNLW